tara:strand:- start:1353 stop:1676 length:324 start_codon:yes stop_codon:yes gene_type:complete
MADNKKISFTDLDTFLKIAPMIGLAVLAYLQTLFPSKVEFDKLEQHLIQMDKKITEMTVLQKAITSNTSDIKQMDNRVRILELDMAKHKAENSRRHANKKESLPENI